MVPTPMLGPLLAAVLAASQPPFSIAIPGLNAVRLEQGEGDLYSNLLSEKLIERGAKVISPRDMGAVLGLERQRQLLHPDGCNESCTAELAAALGVDSLLVGDIGRPGRRYTMTFKLLSSKDAAVLAVYSASDIEVDDMPHAIDRAAYELLRQVAAIRSDLDLGPAPVKSAAPPAVQASGGNRLRRLSLAPAIVGAGAVVFGGVFLGLSRVQLGNLRMATTEPEAIAARDTGSGMQTAGWVAVAVGATAAMIAVVMYFLGGSP